MMIFDAKTCQPSVKKKRKLNILEEEMSFTQVRLYPFSLDMAKWIQQAHVYHSLLRNVRGVAATVVIFISQHAKWVSNHPLLSQRW
jgi:hypothetical protein